MHRLDGNYDQELSRVPEHNWKPVWLDVYVYVAELSEVNGLPFAACHTSWDY